MAVWTPYYNLDCKKCTDSPKEIRGCKEDSTAGECWDFDYFKSARCPMNSLFDQKIGLYLKVYSNYKNGFLPNEGSWLDQPNKVSQIIDIVNREVSKLNDRIYQDGKKK